MHRQSRPISGPVYSIWSQWDVASKYVGLQGFQLPKFFLSCLFVLIAKFTRHGVSFPHLQLPHRNLVYWAPPSLVCHRPQAIALPLSLTPPLWVWPTMYKVCCASEANYFFFLWLSQILSLWISNPLKREECFCLPCKCTHSPND